MFFLELHVMYPGMAEAKMLEVHQAAFQAYQQSKNFLSFAQIDALSKLPFPEN